MSFRTFKSRGMGALTPPSDGLVAGYGGSRSKLRGSIPGSVKACESISSIRSWIDEFKERTVTIILDITIAVMYPPIIGTAGLILCHHQGQVAPNQKPAMSPRSVRQHKNAHGESPPVSTRPSKKKRLREGCARQLRTGFPVFSSITGTAMSGGSSRAEVDEG